MSLRSIPRTFLDSYLKVVKWPVDRAGSRLGGEKAEIAIDRADATVRATAATVIGDGELREDAQRRFTAADERERALKLRLEAELRAERADDKLQERKQSAAQQKQAAAKRAADAKQRAEKAKQAKKKNLEEVEARRLQSNDAATAKKEEAIEAKERRQRLEALNEEAEALEKREEALVTKDEAQRLGKAAAAVKEARKSD